MLCVVLCVVEWCLMCVGPVGCCGCSLLFVAWWLLCVFLFVVGCRCLLLLYVVRKFLLSVGCCSWGVVDCCASFVVFVVVCCSLCIRCCLMFARCLLCVVCMYC